MHNKEDIKNMIAIKGAKDRGRTEHFVFRQTEGGVSKGYYMRHSRDDKTEVKQFLNDRVHYSSHIIGGNKGNNLYAVFGASRTASASSPKDVFFSESQDAGKSWSTPIRVPRENMEDTVDRQVPKVLYIDETGRVFIFFCKTNGGSYAGVYAVSRAKDSAVFSLEAAIDTSYRVLTDVSAVYTYSAGVPLVMVHWFTTHNDPTKGVHIGAYSKDNGNSWKVIKSGHYEYNQVTNLIASTKYNAQQAVMIYNCIAGHIFEVFFDTARDTFFELGSQQKADMTFLTDIAFCQGHSSAPLVYYYGTKLAQDRTAMTNFYRWDMKARYDKLTSPFKASWIYSSSVSCDEVNSKFVASTIFGGSKYSIAINSWAL